VPLAEQELLTLLVHVSSPPVFSGVRVTRPLVLYVCFVDRCLSFGTFSFGHCVVCSSIYGFWLPLWYLQTLLVYILWYHTFIQKKMTYGPFMGYWLNFDIVLEMATCIKYNSSPMVIARSWPSIYVILILHIMGLKG
jgi:hypothetical protein